ncbi:MAG: carboxypeptidase regulatory-like domain-containing protein [Acidobacteria bacterium]|nr:carboxypeptidase regulatory-like domain-containing protein [Acidobacteriota bacterium]
MHSIRRGLLVCLVLGQAGFLLAATEQEERLEDSTRVLQAILDTPDSGIPRDLLEKSECIGIIPSVKKFAFGFGGRYGAGFVLCKKNAGKGAWGAPSAFTLGGGSVGFQLGFSATDFVLLFMNHSGVEKLLQDKFTLGADASVAGGPVGRTASAATDAQLSAQILSYSRSKGLFAGLALEGAVMRPSKDGNRDLYGREVSPKDILIAGTVSPPAAAEPLIRLLSGQGSSSTSASTTAASSAATEATRKTGPGSISGLVRDLSGAVIPDAVITITNSATTNSRWVTTNAQGRYTVPDLVAGSYVINAQATGMKPVTTLPIPLEAGTDQAVDFQLETGP